MNRQSGFTLIEILIGMAIDVETRRPVLANRFGGLSGPAIRPLAVAMVHQVARALLTTQRDKLDSLVAALLQKETIDEAGLVSVLGKRPLAAESPQPPANTINVHDGVDEAEWESFPASDPAG